MNTSWKHEITSQCQTQYTSAYGNNCLAILQNSFQNVGRQIVKKRMNYRFQLERCIEVLETVIVMHLYYKWLFFHGETSLKWCLPTIACFSFEFISYNILLQAYVVKAKKHKRICFGVIGEQKITQSISILIFLYMISFSFQ